MVFCAPAMCSGSTTSPKRCAMVRSAKAPPRIRLRSRPTAPPSYHSRSARIEAQYPPPRPGAERQRPDGAARKLGITQPYMVRLVKEPRRTAQVTPRASYCNMGTRASYRSTGSVGELVQTAPLGTLLELGVCDARESMHVPQTPISAPVMADASSASNRPCSSPAALLLVRPRTRGSVADEEHLHHLALTLRGARARRSAL